MDAFNFTDSVNPWFNSFPMADSLHFKSSKAQHLSVSSFGLDKNKEGKKTYFPLACLQIEHTALNPLSKHEAHEVTLYAIW